MHLSGVGCTYAHPELHIFSGFPLHGPPPLQYPNTPTCTSHRPSGQNAASNSAHAPVHGFVLHSAVLFVLLSIHVPPYCAGVIVRVCCSVPPPHAYTEHVPLVHADAVQLTGHDVSHEDVVGGGCAAAMLHGGGYVEFHPVVFLVPADVPHIVGCVCEHAENEVHCPEHVMHVTPVSHV